MMPDSHTTRTEIQLEDPLYEPVVLESLETDTACSGRTCALPLRASVADPRPEGTASPSKQADSQPWPLSLQGAARLGEGKGWRVKSDHLRKALKAAVRSTWLDTLREHPEKAHRMIQAYGQSSSVLKGGGSRDSFLKLLGLLQEYTSKKESERAAEKPRCREATCPVVPSFTPRKHELNPSNARGELYHVYESFLDTFELRRLMGLQMTGFLSYRYPSSTHTRYAHCVGTWIAGIHALDTITIKTHKTDKTERLFDYLFREDLHREFMAALMLHDIGHAPFSHVLEMNPHLAEYDHERIADELLTGGSAYQELEDILVSSSLDRSPIVARFGAVSGLVPLCAQRIRRGPEGPLLARDVCKSMALDASFISQLFSTRDDRRSDEAKAKNPEAVDEPVDPAVRALRGLVRGPIDIDRVDHIYRDLHYNSFRITHVPILSLFRGMRIDASEEAGSQCGNQPFPFWRAFSLPESLRAELCMTALLTTFT